LIIVERKKEPEDALRENKGKPWGKITGPNVSLYTRISPLQSI
jgi:hypothetical protein